MKHMNIKLNSKTAALVVVLYIFGSIAVLVFAGTNDTQTATSWARQAAEDVTGAQYVEFPNAGHGVIQFSQCAKDIAAAFVDNPDSEVNSACTAELVPRFVLPDEPLGT